MKLNDYLDFHPDVENALKNNLPIVALESTIISHGMPYPKNIETALMVEETVRSNNAVPATIAIIKGRLKIGLTEKEIEFLATNDEIRKISRRDLAIAEDGIPTVLSLVDQVYGLRNQLRQLGDKHVEVRQNDSKVHFNGTATGIHRYPGNHGAHLETKII